MDIQMNLGQRQVLSRRMIQSAEILQMNAQELKEYVEELALENPVIDLAEQRPPEDKAEQRLQIRQWLNSLDEQNRCYYQQDLDQPEDGGAFNVPADSGESLRDYLWSQIITSDFTEEERQILDYMLESLDSRGYMAEDTHEIARRFQAGHRDVERLLHILQQADPPGVCARNLAECLILQLERAGALTPELRSIICGHLDQVAKNQLPAIARELGLPVNRVSEACQIIRRLNPKPGSSFFSRDRSGWLVPDVIIVKFEDYFEILLNEYLYPNIRINGYYRQLSKEASQPETVRYLQEKISQAQWVKDCIAQRNATLLNVTRAILDFQQDFFANGSKNLRPLRLKDVAERLDVHESTISRSVRNKYLQCMWGSFPMNYFFSKGVAASGGEGAMTADQIRNAMARVIRAETKDKPYSDRAIAEELEKLGIRISRRTVAKYRQELGLPDAKGRKAYPTSSDSD